MVIVFRPLLEILNHPTMQSTLAGFVLTAAMRAPVMYRDTVVRRAEPPCMSELDLSALTMRIQTLKSSSSIPTIVMAESCILPGQRLKMHKMSDQFAALLCRLKATEQAGGAIDSHTIAIMVLSDERRPLQLGIQASVASVQQLESGTWEAGLLARRIIRFIGAVEETDYERGDQIPEGHVASDDPDVTDRWLIARIHPIDLKDLDDNEVELNGDTARVLEFLSRELVPLIECWHDLVRKSDNVRFAKSAEELEAHLQELGSLPDVHDYSSRALWVGRLLNPGPMRVAQEIRSHLLQAETALERLYVAQGALVDSIARLKGAEDGNPIFV